MRNAFERLIKQAPSKKIFYYKNLLEMKTAESKIKIVKNSSSYLQSYLNFNKRIRVTRQFHPFLRSLRDFFIIKK